MITHQNIIDRLEALGTEHSKAYEAEQDRQRKERASLQELCGGVGHFYTKADWPMSSLSGTRSCVFCKAWEPKA